MAFVQTFSSVLAPIRADGVPWTTIVIQEASASTGPWTTIDSQAWVDATPATAEPTAITVTTATLESGWYRMYWVDGATAQSPYTAAVYADAAVATGGDIITLAELKEILGIDPTDTREDDRYLAMLPAVSSAIRSYTGREFGLPLATGDRSFFYDGSGYLDIDDATAVNSVTFTFPYNAPDIVLDSESYIVHESPVYTYIEMPGYAGRPTPGVSGEMGFHYNLDTYLRERGNPVARTVTVNGSWGWATVPPEVKLAAAWIIQAWSSRSNAEGLTGESIAGYNRSWRTMAGDAGGGKFAMPDQARDLLAPYTNVEV